MILLHLSITIINSALMEDTASSRHENRIAPAFLTLTKAQNNGFAEQLAFWTLACHLLEEDLGKPGTTWVPDRPCGNHFSSPSPRAQDFPVNGGDCPACIFVSLKLICPCWRMGSRSSEQGRGHEGIKEVTMHPLEKRRGHFYPQRPWDSLGIWSKKTSASQAW